MASFLIRNTARRLSAPALFNNTTYAYSRSHISENTLLRNPLLSSFFSSSIPPPPPLTTTAAFSNNTSSSYLDGLNVEQLEAVTGPLVPTRVIAGPGSGKTKTLTSRIAHLISHHNCRPWQIVAITFTNKAALEMRERLATVLGTSASTELFAGTFHSLCYRILLRSLSLLPDTGRVDGWSIYDADASLAVIYKLVRSVHTEWKSKEAREYAKALQSRISRVKNGVTTYHGVKPIDVVYEYYRTVVTGNSTNMTPAQKASAEDLAEWFDMYEQAMRTANALDFDDLLGYTTAVLRHDVELRERLRRRWRHVLVDEFQDTNSPQYEIVKFLAGIDQDTLNSSEINNNNNSSSSSHVFVVGDTDQAIYGWRGADVRNMRTLFQTDFPTGEVYRLRDNYRSTPGIISAAEAVISRNDDGDRAELRAHRPQGPPIRIRCLQDAFEEAESVSRDIATLIRSNTCKDRNIAVLFRTHMQARFIEQQLVKNSIPYVLVGGVSFWRRVEIQDILAYVRLAISLDDEVALKRVLNVPKRGIGEVSIAKLEAAGVESEGGSLCKLFWTSEDTLKQRIDGIEPLPVVKKVLSAKTAAMVEQFRSTLLQMREALATQPLSVALQRIIELAEYKEHVNKGGCGTKEDEDDIQDRLLRLRQLVAAATEFRPGTAAGAAALDAAFAAIDLEEDEKIDQRISQLLNEKTGKDSKLEKKLFSAAVEVEAMTTEEVTAVGNDNGDQKVSECSSKSSTESSGELLATARAFLDEAALYSGADEGADVDGIRLMTMHAAKGLEFEVVFVPGCVEGLVPLFNPERGDTVDDLEEETRLFFVSMTRAKSDLRLSYTRVNALQGPQNRRPNIPSRYLQDVVKSGHAVVEEENSMMMGAARSRKHYDFKNNSSGKSSGGRSSGYNSSGGKSGGGARPRGARTTGRVPAPVASSEWGSDSDWIDDKDSVIEDPFIAEEVPLRPAQIRALKRAGRR